MTRPVQDSRVISGAVLLASGLTPLAVPPSLPLQGISEPEAELLKLVLPLLAAAFGLALIAMACSLGGRHRNAGLFGVLSLLLINVAGLLSGQFGAGGVGLLGTLVVTAPLAYVLAARETRWRRSQLPGAEGAR